MRISGETRSWHQAPLKVSAELKAGGPLRVTHAELPVGLLRTGQRRLHLRRRNQAPVPAALELGRNLPVLGVDPVKLPERPIGFVAGLLQRQFRLPNGIRLRLAILFNRPQRRLHGDRLDRPQKRPAHGLVHAAAVQ